MDGTVDKFGAWVHSMRTEELARRRATDAEFRRQYDAWLKTHEPPNLETTLPEEVLNASRWAYDLKFEPIPVGKNHYVRAVGEMVTVLRHWNHKGAICFGHECQFCPDERRENGFLDSILARTDIDGRPTLFRAITSIPEAAVRALAGTSLRGRKFQFFRKTEFSKTIVSPVHEACPFELPEPVDIRQAIIRRFHLPHWPGEKPEAEKPGEPVAILKFRKQA